MLELSYWMLTLRIAHRMVFRRNRLEMRPGPSHLIGDELVLRMLKLIWKSLCTNLLDHVVGVLGVDLLER